jgi:5-methylcytosine-specific restriction endonuclease McrA
MAISVPTAKRSDDAQYKRLRIWFKAECRRRNEPCWLCVQRGADEKHAAINYDAPQYAPDAFELDHEKPWDTHPHLRYSPQNAKASHSRCNRQRGRRMQKSMPGAQGLWIRPDF